MPSYKTKQDLKRKRKHIVIPNLAKDLKSMRSGKDLSCSQGKNDKMMAFVEARGM